jgi:hypothetical protein
MRKPTAMTLHKTTSKSERADFCHTFSSNRGVSSQRTRAAAGAHVLKSSAKLLSRNAVKRLNRRSRRKQIKQDNDLVNVYSPGRKVHGLYTIPFLKDNVLVFDGGDGPSTAPISNPKVPGWCCHRIVHGELDVCVPPSPDKGLMYKVDSSSSPCFILLPRKDAISINADGRALCQAMSHVARKKKNLVRGNSKTVFGEHKYCCIGSQPRRNAKGVECGQYNLNGVAKEEWDCIVSAVKRSEHAFYSYVGTEAIRHICDANELVPWERLQCSNGNAAMSPSIYNGIAFGVNVYLRAHVDNDFTYSVIQVHVDGMDYGLEDEIICYFCFPLLGTAVPLCLVTSY